MPAPSRSSGSGDLTAGIDPAELSRLLKDVKAFNKELATATRKRLRTAGEAGVKDVQRHLRSGPSKQGKHVLREGLAKGTKTSIRGGSKTAGVSIVTTGVKLSAAKQAMTRAYNKRSFRHPVGGNRDVWVNQRGRPYFGAVLDEHKPDMQRAMEQALRDAADTIRSADPA